MVTETLTDSFGRPIDYLRISVTDRCNFRCVYCMPEAGAEVCASESLLTLDDFGRVAKIARSLGFRKVRVTGGEPLTRKGLVGLICELSTLGYDDISMTTNGYGLAEFAKPLARAGLNRINVSLDTLRSDRFTRIARRGSLDRVLAGIDAAFGAGLEPVKVNCVSMLGVNDDEVVDFASWTLRRPVHVRFIELMPIAWNMDGDSGFSAESVFPTSGLIELKQASSTMLDGAQMARMRIDSAELRTRIESAMGPLEPSTVVTNGPARTFRLADGLGTIGFISQISNDLCANCNRLRLTADGALRPCLMADGELDLRTPLRAGASDTDLADLFRRVVAAKPLRHHLADGQRASSRTMSAIGG